MAESSGISKVLRDLTQAYVDGLSTIGNAIGDLGKRRMPDSARMVEGWVSVARAAKDGYVAAIDQGFASWERQIRRTLTPAESQSESESESKRDQKTSTNPLEAWAGEWRKATESFTQSVSESGLGKEALKQAKDFQKTFESSVKNLQKLWEPGRRK